MSQKQQSSFVYVLKPRFCASLQTREKDSERSQLLLSDYSPLSSSPHRPDFSGLTQIRNKALLQFWQDVHWKGGGEMIVFLHKCTQQEDLARAITGT